MRNFILLASAFFCSQIYAQTTGKVIDASTGESIPYANIQYNGSQSLISNTEGFFTVPEANSGDATMLSISFIGYAPVQLTIGELKSRKLTVSMQQSVYELDAVNVSERPSANAIMASVRKYLKDNYSDDGKIVKNNIFVRQANFFSPKKLNVEIEKSTGFSKAALKTFNGELGAFTSRLVANPPREYTDMLCQYYTAPGKTAMPNKLAVIKATKLKDESRAVSLDGLQGNATDLLLKHLDTTKYYRIRSGWFGLNDTVSLRKDFKKAKGKAKNTEVGSAKTRLAAFSGENNFLSPGLEFIHKPDFYEYAYEGAVLLADGNFAYVVTFKPDRNKAKYKGKLFVSASDFGVIRADYQLDDGKTLKSVNLKMLLGLKISENVRKGTIIYRQNPSGKGYYLQYASREEGQYIYLHRPLKFIELSETEKDVVAFDLKIEGSGYNKTEYLTLSQNDMAEADYDNVKEDEFKYVRIKQYDPTIWKNYAAIEPLQEMKRYKIEGGTSDSELAKQMAN